MSGRDDGDRAPAAAAPDAPPPPAGRGDAPGAALSPRGISLDVAIEEAELARAPADRGAARVDAWRARLATHLAIGLGGLLGANARYLVGAWAAARWGEAFPWGTLLINTTGGLALGCYLTLATERFAGRSTVRLFVATGFLGAYTTFSTFSYEAVSLARHGAVGAAVAYVVASLALGLAAVVVGILAARAL